MPKASQAGPHDGLQADYGEELGGGCGVSE
jgi:hypothetical protein